MQWRLTIALAVLLLFTGTDSQGQAARIFPLTGRGAYSRSFVNVFSGMRNQAALARLKTFSAGAFLQQRFSVEALRLGYFAAALPTASGTFSLQGMVGGYKYFQRQQLDLAFSKKLFNLLDAGIQINYLNMRVPSYGSAHAFTFTISTLFHFSRQWHLGIQVFNPAEIAYQKLGNDPIPAVYLLGLGYQPSRLFLLTTELQYFQNNATISLAFQYHIAKVLSLKAGAGSGVYPVFAGLHLHLKKMEILLSAAYHRKLGLSPGAGFIFINKPAGE